MEFILGGVAVCIQEVGILTEIFCFVRKKYLWIYVSPSYLTLAPAARQERQVSDKHTIPRPRPCRFLGLPYHAMGAPPCFCVKLGHGFHQQKCNDENGSLQQWRKIRQGNRYYFMYDHVAFFVGSMYISTQFSKHAM